MPDPGTQIPVGFIRRAHGIRGDLLVKPLTDHPDRFVVGATFSVDRAPHTVTVTSVRSHRDGLLLGVEEIADRTAAEALAKATLTIAATERRALEAGEYWPDDLVGLGVVDPSGEALGTVTDVVVGAAQDRLAVTTPDGVVVEVPFVAALVGAPAEGRITIDAPEGLFPAPHSAVPPEDAE